MVTLVLAAIVVADQVTPPTHTEIPPTEQETTTPDKTLSSDKTDKPDSTGVVDTDVENQRRFDALRNELRRELLDDRADTINWWLTATAIFLTFFGIVVVLGGYIGFQRFEKIEADAQRAVEEIKKAGDEELERLRGINAKTPRDSEVEKIARQVQQNPEASALDRALADAFTLQQEGNIEDAIEKWRAIANIAEGSDNDLAARAWFSIGYLLQGGGVEDAEQQ